MTEEEYIILFEKYQYGICTSEELELLNLFQDKFQLQNLEWKEGMGDKGKTEEAIYASMQREMHNKNKAVIVSVWRYRRIAVAAAVLIFISIGSYLYFFNKPKTQTALNDAHQILKNDVLPGGNKATLTLANGAKIILDSTQNGIIAQQGNAKISKLTNGQLVYNTSGEKLATIAYNILSTPRGGQYQLTLPDGSLVWLNAASSIRYPTAFTGTQRNVEITGEAYFEVAKNPSKPFIVTANGMQVEVLGTHFNINAYADETSIKTTLLEGTVQIKKGVLQTVLKPGQQAQLNESAGLKILNNINVDDVVAWKNGFISFKSADLKTIMRQVSRWYDVDVVYEGNIVQRNFTGEISRSANLSELLKILQASNIQFEMKEKKLIVM
ncbi:MAG: FecR domain-containing protein, partial [Parafilimonas sp.]